MRTATDPARDVVLNDGGDVTRRQDQAGVDVIGAGEIWTGKRVCFQVRFRTPLPERASLALSLNQRVRTQGHRLLLQGAVGVDLDGDEVVAWRGVSGGRYFPVEVVMSPSRDALSVEIDSEPGWLEIDPSERHRWEVEAWAPIPGIGNAYYDDLQP